jgi:hypothetical protein
MFQDEGDLKPWDEYGEGIDAEELRQKEDDPMDLGRNLVRTRCAWGVCERECRASEYAEVAWFERILGTF